MKSKGRKVNLKTIASHFLLTVVVAIFLIGWLPIGRRSAAALLLQPSSPQRHQQLPYKVGFQFFHLSLILFSNSNCHCCCHWFARGPLLQWTLDTFHDLPGSGKQRHLLLISCLFVDNNIVIMFVWVSCFLLWLICEQEIANMPLVVVNVLSSILFFFLLDFSCQQT